MSEKLTDMRSPAALRGKLHSCSLTVSENRSERTQLGAGPGVDTVAAERKNSVFLAAERVRSQDAKMFSVDAFYQAEIV